MSAIKVNFSKTIKVRGTRVYSLSQEHVRNVCRTVHYYLTKFYFDSP